MKRDSVFDQLHTKELYLPDAKDLMIKQFKCIKKMQKFNRIKSSLFGVLRRTHMMKKMFGSVGKNCYIEPPFYANFGGKNVFLGDNVYANFGLTLVDDTYIYVGSNTMFAPNVVVATASHPISPQLRGANFQYNLPVHIGSRVWIGAGAIILPGVTIGDNTIIGAGSVVTKDIPANVVAVGNPCKILREITEEDDKIYNRTCEIPKEIIDKYIKK